MNSLLRGLMASEANTNRALPSLILLGIVDFCCILIGLEQISVGKVSSGVVWIALGVGSGFIGYYWSQVKQAIASAWTGLKKKPSKLVIHWANYRAVEGGGDVYEVGDFLRQIISGDSLVFDIENHNFKIGGKDFVSRDPLTGTEKRLQVTYSYGGSLPITTERREHGRLLLPEDSKIKWLASELDRITTMYLEESQQRAKLQDECTQTGNKVLQLEAALSKRPELSLSSLQIDAMRLSLELLDFLKRIGTPPAPKYTAAEIDNMTSARMKELIDANDGDFFEACEYYRAGRIAFNQAQSQSQLTAQWTRLFPFYQKVAASYALTFKDKVEAMQHRFTIEGMADWVLSVPVQGAVAIENIRAIAAKLWELALRVSERG
jgi:hypothetical protein